MINLILIEGDTLEDKLGFNENKTKELNQLFDDTLADKNITTLSGVFKALTKASNNDNEAIYFSFRLGETTALIKAKNVFVNAGIGEVFKSFTKNV